jgi:UDP-2-acetamido-3-amino-2,3-dideoxy-glucuronate N-acetyltransferase
VPDYALVVGNPGRQKGWMSRHGHRLTSPDAAGIMTCPESGFRSQLQRNGEPHAGAPGEADRLRCLDLGEDEPLPEALRQSDQSYDAFKGERQ